MEENEQEKVLLNKKIRFGDGESDGEGVWEGAWFSIVVSLKLNFCPI